MSRKNRLAGCALSAALGFSLVPAAHAGNLILNDVYHAQTTSYTCAIASIEMQLDIPLITGANPFVSNLLATGDGAYVGIGAAPTANTAQSYIYYMVHANNAANIANNKAYDIAQGQANLNNFFYNNQFINPVPGSGTDTDSLQFAANTLDNPAPGGPGLGNDAYTSFNVASGFYASRTIAAAMQDTKIPAIVTVNRGAHDISVFGVNTTGVAARNTSYTINGFFVHDPATGYVLNAPGVPANVPLGIGINTFLRYGYDKPIPGAPQLTLPDGTQATLSKLTWFNYFNVSGPQGAPTVNQIYQNGPGYKFQAEPQGPESLDTGGPDGTFYGLPTLTPLLPSQLTQSQADADAAPDLASDSLTSDFSGDTLDAADTMLLTDPSDPTAQGDWLVPYDGGSGINDVTGMIAIDEDTGVIDQATWFDATDSTQSLSLAQMDAMFADDINGILPDDNPDVPEPASMALLIPVGAFLLNRRRSKHD